MRATENLNEHVVGGTSITQVLPPLAYGRRMYTQAEQTFGFDTAHSPLCPAPSIPIVGAGRIRNPIVAPTSFLLGGENLNLYILLLLFILIFTFHDTIYRAACKNEGGLRRKMTPHCTKVEPPDAIEVPSCAKTAPKGANN